MKGWPGAADTEPTRCCPASHVRQDHREAAEASADATDAMTQRRLLVVYLDGIDDWGRKEAGFDSYDFIGARPPNAPSEDPLWE